MSNIASALTQLARVRDPQGRAALALGVTDICVTKPLTNRTQPLANDILLSLAHKVEESVRIQMAAQLADCDWAPKGIIRFLAFDAPSVAAEIIRKSQVLEADDLIELAETGIREHRLLIAGRDHIGIGISDAVAARAETDVIERLIQNTTARLSNSTIQICAEAARTNAGLSQDLLNREDIPPSIVDSLTRQISKAVHDQVEQHFDLESGKLDELGENATGNSPTENDDELARGLVEQMAARGELNGTVAVRALTDGRFILFDYSIAYLCSLEVDQWRSAIGMSSMRATALACRAARIDKTLFPSVVRGLQKSGRIQDDLPSEAMITAAKVFQKFTPGSAHDALRRLAQSV
ncbi:MAG: hypothetical protein DHS20C06_15810 [Hyphobacterium sp.]|nr:MAG: hypothetical protein DHS20C06_15810 [Hyphobacterium sp.]